MNINSTVELGKMLKNFIPAKFNLFIIISIKSNDLIID